MEPKQTSKSIIGRFDQKPKASPRSSEGGSSSSSSILARSLSAIVRLRSRKPQLIRGRIVIILLHLSPLPLRDSEAEASPLEAESLPQLIRGRVIIILLHLSALPLRNSQTRRQARVQLLHVLHQALGGLQGAQEAGLWGGGDEHDEQRGSMPKQQESGLQVIYSKYLQGAQQAGLQGEKQKELKQKKIQKMNKHDEEQGSMPKQQSSGLQVSYFKYQSKKQSSNFQGTQGISTYIPIVKWFTGKLKKNILSLPQKSKWFVINRLEIFF